ncbi:hypothetical protein Adu01nite_33860 [Paractinoplanes durhamensis]|uniref:Uncharacterized protein n=1 Tax=Paractinoplanes durhamensis TaxID=113563 RepID=A0ABQ3YWS6_9ACTN|nr:hypothetical protein Adu01nite_33860 [Actinoplanes durhamensis]
MNRTRIASASFRVRRRARSNITGSTSPSMSTQAAVVYAGPGSRCWAYQTPAWAAVSSSGTVVLRLSSSGQGGDRRAGKRGGPTGRCGQPSIWAISDFGRMSVQFFST